LALDGSNWQTIDLLDFQAAIENDMVEKMSKRCGGFLKKLSLQGCETVNDEALRIFAQYCSNIEELDVSQCVAITDRLDTLQVYKNRNKNHDGNLMSYRKQTN
jgi:F-box/leucine-rich repeat protein 2/20